MKLWKWLNTPIHEYGWSVIQAIVFLLCISPFIALLLLSGCGGGDPDVEIPEVKCEQECKK